MPAATPIPLPTDTDGLDLLEIQDHEELNETDDDTAPALDLAGDVVAPTGHVVDDDLDEEIEKMVDAHIDPEAIIVADADLDIDVAPVVVPHDPAAPVKPKPHMVATDLIERPLRPDEWFDEGAL